MAPHADDGSSYHRPRFRLVSGLSRDASDPVGDARVELIVELTYERRVRLARRLAEIDSTN
jgi:hypothetical protein